MKISTKNKMRVRRLPRTRKPGSAKQSKRRAALGDNWKRTHAIPVLKRAKRGPGWLPPGVSELEYDLTEILSRHVGERPEDQKHGEGAVDVLCRIIRERDTAMKLLALDRMRGQYNIW